MVERQRGLRMLAAVHRLIDVDRAQVGLLGASRVAFRPLRAAEDPQQYADVRIPRTERPLAKRYGSCRTIERVVQLPRSAEAGGFHDEPSGFIEGTIAIRRRPDFVDRYRVRARIEF